jgi:hypothetical protein
MIDDSERAVIFIWENEGGRLRPDPTSGTPAADLPGASAPHRRPTDRVRPKRRAD